MSLLISRRGYADMYGPITGDRVRLGDNGPAPKRQAAAPSPEPPLAQSNKTAPR